MDKGKARSVAGSEATTSRSNSNDGGRTSSEASLGDLEATESMAFSKRPAQHPRAMSFSSLQFAAMPIALSVQRVDPDEAQREIKHLSLIGAVALTVGSQVGGGIFSAPVCTF